jgi:uncharacterized protein YjbI with pentapeptide repeats
MPILFGADLGQADLTGAHLGKADLRYDNLRSVDSWNQQRLELLVTWNRTWMPVFISFTTPKGASVLSLDEAKTLAGYFGLSNMFTPTRANPSIHLCRHEFQRDIRRTNR